MSALRDAIDYTTLGWIKPELDETLRQARMAIEAFAALVPGDPCQRDAGHAPAGPQRRLRCF